MRTLFYFIVICFCFSLKARENPERVPNQVILRFQSHISLHQAHSLVEEYGGQILKILNKEMNIHLVHTGNQSIPLFEERVRILSSVKWIQPNHLVQMRAEPNDQDFSQQWALKNEVEGMDIQASQAWDFGVGGPDAQGHDVVVAVVDGGVDVEHSQLSPNTWVNTHEVAGNGVDDDQNGYVDDVNGWNALNSNGEIPSSSHGTHVAGIIGAKGNDQTQVSGVNWNTKIMVVAGASRSTSTVLEAYGYILSQKKRWISSGGISGANVVATNSSFGVDGADCQSSQFLAWNDMYNEMGKYGILSIAATANNSVDVDREGDVPTGCQSPFIVSVTNMDREGKKAAWAGYGKTTIDLGAPGTKILSTIPNNKVTYMSGTSMATPHVTGAVALMHHSASSDFNDMYLSSFSKGALVLKQILLESVQPLGELNGRTVSGGQLNLFQSVYRISKFEAKKNQFSNVFNFFEDSFLFPVKGARN